MAGTVTRTVLLKINADDMDAQAKLDAITAKADELRDMHPELTVRIDTAEAAAKMAVFRDELKEATRPVKVEIKPEVNKRDLAKAETDLGVFARLLGGIFGGGSGGGGIFSPLAEGGAGPIPAFLTSPAGIAAAIPLVGALAVELTGVVSGFAAAGLGVGSFAALAIPTLDSIKTAYTNITTAQATYHAALLLEKQDPTTGNKTAVTTALAQLKIAEDNVSPSTRTAVLGIDQLKNSYEAMAKAFAPDALKIFNDALGIANTLLPDLKPLADAAVTPIDSMLKKLGSFFQTTQVTGTMFSKGKLIDTTQLTGFGQFLNYMKQLEGPAITAIGAGIGRVATNIGKLIQSMSAKDVVHSLNIAFDVISGTIKGLTFVVQTAMQQWDNLDRIWHNTMSVASSMSLTLGNVLIRIGQDVSNWARDVGTDTGKVVTWFKELPGKIMAAIGNLGSELFSAGSHVVSMFASGIRSEIGAVASAIGSVASEVWDHIPHSPAKKGPLSGAGSPDIAGRRVSEMFAGGIRAGLPAVMGSSSAMAHAAGLTTGGGARLAGAGGPVVVTLDFQGADQALVTALKKIIRVRGGDPNVLGR